MQFWCTWRHMLLKYLILSVCVCVWRQSPSKGQMVSNCYQEVSMKWKNTTAMFPRSCSETLFSHVYFRSLIDLHAFSINRWRHLFSQKSKIVIAFAVTFYFSPVPHSCSPVPWGTAGEKRLGRVNMVFDICNSCKLQHVVHLHDVTF